MNTAWFALFVMPKHEKSTGRCLSFKGYEHLVPTRRERRSWSDRIAEVEVPIFPRYIFCRFQVSEHLSAVLSTPGVLSVVMLGNKPAPIEDHEIASVEALMNSGFPIVAHAFIPSGAAVQIVAGPLRGVTGLVIGSGNDTRVVVSITMLQRSVSVPVDRRWIRLKEASA